MRITVEGQQPLKGEYAPSGNANAALSLLAAALLTDQPVTLHNVPQTTSVRNLRALAEWLGAAITGDTTLNINAPQLTQRSLSAEQIGSPGTLLLIAPVLVRRQYVHLEIDFPLNRIRTHLEALRDLGIDVVVRSGTIECQAVTWDSRDVFLSQASVTATAIVLMLAASLGKETLIHNAACEPHVVELCLMLEAMGAHIEGIGSNVLRVFSSPDLEGVEVTVGPDHIEAASIAAIAAMTQGRIQITGTRLDDMRMIAKIYQRLGIELDLDEDSLFVPKHQQLSVLNREEDVDSSIETAIWPGFPSDLVGVATVIASQAKGTSLIHEKLFNNRLLFVDRLKAMGAQIVLCDPHRAIVVGPSKLYGTYMASPDIRTGLGMLSAALVAEGESVIDNAESISHTFGDVLDKLKAIGACIQYK